MNLRRKENELIRKAVACLIFAGLKLNLILCPIGLNAANNNKAKTNRYYLCLR